MNTSSATSSKAVDTLNSLVRGEISAVETYDHVLSKFANERLPELEENRASHRNRVELLSERVRQLGGVPATSSGARGVIANLAEATASLFGKDAAINALESDEDRSLVDYRKAVEELDSHSGQLVVNDLLPEQARTHRRMSNLKHDRKSITDSASRPY